MSTTRTSRRAAAARLAAAVAASATPAVTPAALRAQAAPPPTIDACYVPATGTVYRVNTKASPAAGAPNGCLSAAHVRFTWNQQGPKGDKGDRGDPGLFVIE